MYLIQEKKQLTEHVTLMKIYAPEVCRHAKAGQFVMLRVDASGERIPLTIADVGEDQTITIIFQVVGKTTYLLNQKQKGEYLSDFAGPLGKKTEIEHLNKVLVIGGGVGCAISYPIVKALHQKGAHVDTIIGFRSKNFVFFEEAFKSFSHDFYLMTDDGSAGEKGLVTEKMKTLLDQGRNYDEVIAIGPLPMMKYVSLTTKPYGIKTIVSMNPIMVDGTGMCGGCRVKVGDHMKFACVDGPEFDGHAVDFDDAMKRQTMYHAFEKDAYEHICNLTKELTK